jgi:intracellular septation protein
VVFGGATLWLQNEAFIKWKPTALYWLFGGVLLGSKLFAGRNLMQKLLGEKISMPDTAWTRLNLAWALFFLAAGALNLFVAFSGWFTEDQWVNFKVFGLMALLIVFVIGQSVWLGKHIEQPSEDGSNRPPAANDPKL